MVCDITLQGLKRRVISSECPEIEEERQFFEYFVQTEAGDEERRFLEARMPINEVTSRLVRNALEPWIAEEVLIR